MSMRQKIIIDTDPGTDDALAILMILEAHKRKAVEVIAITTVHGNSSLKNVNNNLLHVLKTANVDQIALYSGASEALVHDFVNNELFHGKDGFGDTNLEMIIAENSFRKENASVALVRLIMENKGDVILICLGPLTNVALASHLQPECLGLLKDFYIMGGNLTGRGNATASGEFNFLCDPESANVVFNRSKKHIKLTTWEPCIDAIAISDEERQELGSCRTPAANLMNLIEAHIFKDCIHYTGIWWTCDQIAAAWMLDECLRKSGKKLVSESSHFYADVEVVGMHTRGQMVVDRMVLQKKIPNFEALLKLDKDIYMQYLKMGFGWNLDQNPWEY